jgi:hypothetical protein
LEGKAKLQIKRLRRQFYLILAFKNKGVEDETINKFNRQKR